MNGDNSDPSLSGVNASNENIRKKAGVESGMRIMNNSSNPNNSKNVHTKAISNNKIRAPTTSETENF